MYAALAGAALIFAHVVVYVIARSAREHDAFREGI